MGSMGSIICEIRGCQNEALYETESGVLICAECAQNFIETGKYTWEDLEEI